MPTRTTCHRSLRSLLLTALLLTGTGAMAQLLPQGHSHNDYRRARPLYMALDHGFMSVEVDVHLRRGRLLVGHDGFFLRKRRTLERIYLAPLYALAGRDAFLSVHAGGPPGFVLYIDVKRGCPALPDTLIAQLQRYQDMLTVWDQGVRRQGAVNVIVRPCDREQEWLSRERRWFQFEGRHHHLGGPYDAEVVPRVGMPLRRITKWRGRGPMPPEDLAQLRALVAQAQAEGRQLRSWAATNRPAVWRRLLDEGVEVINVDRIRRFARFMEKR
jgi:glycerophosphoryl diester phosphodiesterase